MKRITEDKLLSSDPVCTKALIVAKSRNNKNTNLVDVFILLVLG
jgi:hypothetical protein